MVRRYFTFLPDWAKNALVAPGIWLCSACLGWAASYFADQVIVLIVLFVFFVLWYHVTYRFLARLPEMDNDGNQVGG